MTMPYPEQIPADATAPTLADDHCIACPAPPLIVARKVVTETTGEPNIWPKARAAVREVKFCGSHANRSGEVLDDGGWVIVLDRRQALTDGENTAA
jgi:hypothetical protein